MSAIGKVSPYQHFYLLIIQIMMAILPVFILMSTKHLLDTIITEKLLTINTFLSLGYFSIIQILQITLQQIQSHLLLKNQMEMTNHFEQLILKKIQSVPYSFFEKPEYQNNLYLAQQQSSHKIPIIFQAIQSIFLHLISLGALLIYFFSIIKYYAWIVLLVAVPLAIIKWISGNRLQALEKHLAPQERESTYLYHLLTNTQFAKEIRTLSVGEKLINTYSQFKSEIKKKREQLNLKIAYYSLVAEIMELIVLIWILVGVLKLAIIQAISFGVLIVYMQGLQRIQSTLKLLLQSFVQLLQQRIFLKELFNFLELKEISGARYLKAEINLNRISVKNLSFRYPDTNKEILTDINFEAKKGELIAIVGANGSGKSSLVKLLAGLYQLENGFILFNENDISNYDSKTLAKISTFLFQDFEKIFLSVNEIISLGTLESSPIENNKIEIAASFADAADFIKQLPKQYETRLGRIFDNSAQISGGQWQKLLLARAFYRNSQLLVLDEPTSNIDAVSENIIFKNLSKFASDKITILITHRLYNLKMADKIIVMQNGRIVESGKFETLKRNTNGIFYQLYTNQVI